MAKGRDKPKKEAKKPKAEKAKPGAAGILAGTSLKTATTKKEK
jgi:hypothetical protein